MFSKIYAKIKKFIVDNKTFLISFLIILFVCNYELSYVIYKPGGIVSLSDRIEIEDSNINGDIAMSYVSLLRGKIPVVLLSFIFPNWDLIPDEEITTEDLNVTEVLELEKLYMKSSLDYATIVAYQKAEKEINITKEVNNIIHITDKAQTDLKMYDIILEIEGEAINYFEDIEDVIANFQVGDKVNILVERNGKEKECSAIIYEEEGRKLMGVVLLKTYEYETNPDINITTKNSESGSSGGLMLTLAIYDKISEIDLARGRTIVGTGTISVDGTVGEIDGVKYKLLGAEKNDADIFLCPAENYDEAIKIKEENDIDIEIVSVSTIDDALNYLLK